MEEFIRESNHIEGVYDESEVTQSLIAWNHLRDFEVLTHKTIQETHELIMANLLPPEDRGKYRNRGVQVGNRICPEPYELHPLMTEFIIFMNSSEYLDPKELHVAFEKIHPFIDGNGRTGRMLMWWQEIFKLKGEPTMILEEDKYEYYKWFKTPKEIAQEENLIWQRTKYEIDSILDK